MATGSRARRCVSERPQPATDLAAVYNSGNVGGRAKWRRVDVPQFRLRCFFGACKRFMHNLAAGTEQDLQKLAGDVPAAAIRMRCVKCGSTEWLLVCDGAIGAGSAEYGELQVQGK